MLRITGKYAACFCGFIVLFVVLLTAAYAIPDRQIEWHREFSLDMLAIEEEYETWGNIYGMNSMPGMLDNTTDRVMLSLTQPEQPEMSALETGLFVNGYTRYWHGYQVILRPMLVLYQIHQIRYLNQFVFFGLFAMTVCMLLRRLGKAAACGFFISICCSLATAIPSSMQFMACYVIMMLAVLFLLWRYPFEKRENVPLFFMAVGMLVNFFDFLTVPLITLGIPLLVCLALENGAQKSGGGGTPWSWPARSRGRLAMRCAG